MPKKIVTKIEEGLKSGEQNLVKENTVYWSQNYKAQVVEIVGRTGMRGEATHVIVKILEGKDAGKILRRNVVGPVRVGDIIVLRETEISATPIETEK